MIRLQKQIKEKLQLDIEFRKKLADLRGSDTQVAYLLIKKNSPYLTMLPVVNLIKEHTGLTEDEIFEKVEELRK
ncbi:hypothetical protein QIU18_00595 [Capnocytophaga canimorsus]|nr:hypothetical protein [Capnocytophaga canimorsus]WGU70688.1 hypothetical protein QIU18_00595 [Capnocytophaga canimorsus]